MVGNFLDRKFLTARSMIVVDELSVSHASMHAARPQIVRYVRCPREETSPALAGLTVFVTVCTRLVLSNESYVVCIGRATELEIEMRPALVLSSRVPV